MKKFISLILLSVTLASSAFAEEYYCESGDPGGGGPSADLSKSADGQWLITVNYSAKDLEYGSSDSQWTFVGSENESALVDIDGAPALRRAFTKNGMTFELISSPDSDDYVYANLINFSASVPSMTLGCQ